MSKRVCFTCSMLLLLGLAGGYDLLLAATSGRAHFNPLVLFLPVSIGLFLALPGSRTAATVVFWIHYLVLGLILLLSLVGNASLTLPANPLGQPVPIPFPLAFVVVAMIGSILALLHWLMCSRPFDDHLGP